MRIAVTVAVLLAVVSTALVAVCQHSETRRLQRRVWQLERRRMRLERQIQRLESAVEANRTPRRLLVENDLDLFGLFGRAPSACEDSDCPATFDEAARRRARRGSDLDLPAGFVLGENFEGGER